MSEFKKHEGSEMQDADTYLELIRERGKRGLPLARDVYKHLLDPKLYLKAYGKIYRNAGTMTPGTTVETVDGMSLAKIGKLIEVLRHERYQWTPVRRTYIPKKNGKTRPLGIPTWSDKLLQEALRQLLEAYYEPQFSEHSHGFRPERGAHTALREIGHSWQGTTWFIEADISRCFDSLDHQVMIETIREKIQDGRILHLIDELLKAGYLEDWKWQATLSGCPQVTVEREGKNPLIARWGGIPLMRKKWAVLNDNPSVIWKGRTELVKRLLADTCEYCGSKEQVEVHHIRALKDLNKYMGREKPEWVKRMAARRRKTLILCRECHVNLHAGRPLTRKMVTNTKKTEPESRMQ